jgi:hypothetical protein
VVVDRPFIFAVMDRINKIPVLVGKVNNPTSMIERPHLMIASEPPRTKVKAEVEQEKTVVRAIPATCYAVRNDVRLVDMWCMSNCRSPEPYCPASHCACS